MEIHARKESAMQIRDGKDFEMEICVGKDFSSLWIRNWVFFLLLQLRADNVLENEKLRERRLEGEERAFLLSHYMCIQIQMGDAYL